MQLTSNEMEYRYMLIIKAATAIALIQLNEKVCEQCHQLDNWALLCQFICMARHEILNLQRLLFLKIKG
jgi:hypothetical protein